MEERLHKLLAHSGVGSRRECEEIIAQGRVTVNGRMVTKPGTKADPGSDEIRVDGERVKVEDRVYYLVNKPKGYLCTNRDTHGRPRVIDLVPEKRRIYTVGRLDEDSEGLVLLTNDGAVTNVVCHPRYQVDKTYRLSVRGAIRPEQLEKIERGVWLAEGRTGPAQVRRVERKKDRTVVTVTLWEGRNRELRRMFAKVGLRVVGLVRTAIGPLRADGTRPGDYRRLRPSELGFVHNRTRPGWKPVRTEKPAPRRGKPRARRDERRAPRPR